MSPSKRESWVDNLPEHFTNMNGSGENAVVAATLGVSFPGSRTSTALHALQTSVLTRAEAKDQALVLAHMMGLWELGEDAADFDRFLVETMTEVERFFYLNNFLQTSVDGRGRNDIISVSTGWITATVNKARRTVGFGRGQRPNDSMNEMGGQIG